MGDRAMAEIRTKEGSLFFYTHWCGDALPRLAQHALDGAQPRLDDEPYALRIIVDQLIKLTGCRDQETGAGLLFKPHAEDEYNNNDPSVLIDLTKNQVRTFRNS